MYENSADDAPDGAPQGPADPHGLARLIAFLEETLGISTSPAGRRAPRRGAPGRPLRKARWRTPATE